MGIDLTFISNQIQMGHRTHLILHSNNKETILFETNNSLAFFWIGFISSTEINTHKINESSTFKVSKKLFLERSENMKYFIRDNFSNSLPLYNDFIHHISSQLSSLNDSIEIDIMSIANFSSIDTFLNVLCKNIEAIEKRTSKNITLFDENDLIAFGCGFSTVHNSFSPHYTDALNSRNSLSDSSYSKQKKDSISLYTYSAILLICPLFTYIIFYKGWAKEGATLGVMSLLFFNVLFYIFSIFGIKEKIRR